MEEIIDDAGLSDAMSASREGPVFLFKHSTACPISSTAYQEIAGYVEQGGDDVRPVYLVKVIESRQVSNAISTRTGVEHKSPQLILLNGEAAVWTASHYGINREAMAKATAG